MAIVVPAPHLKHVRMTSGERRFIVCLLTKLEDDYHCWFNVPIRGRRQLHPDFIVLHPGRGLLVLEVKDWNLETLRRVDRMTVDLLTNRGLVSEPNPLEQARQYVTTVVDLLKDDPLLIQHGEGPHQGKLLFPWGYGVVLTNITRSQFTKAQLGQAIEPSKVICQDEMTKSIDPESFQKRLWNMFNYHFGAVLALARIDRIRWHLFPEIRIDQGLLFDDAEAPDPNQSIAHVLPDIVKIMDFKQEELARNLGDGHRVIHGVAGSGKTLILAYRCVQLAEIGLGKPVLVLCYNRTLAAKLQQVLSGRNVGDSVHVYNFHHWCNEQTRLYHVDVAKDRDLDMYYRNMIQALMDAAEKGRVPRAQYSAILIDEGHDFEPEWFRLVVQMIDPQTNSLLLLYDDAQSIYGRRQKFTWASVGIQAQGRTTILKLNYRNTAELLAFAYDFVKDYLEASDDEHPIVRPEMVGRHGPDPVAVKLRNFQAEIDRIAEWLRARQSCGVLPSETAVLYRYKWQAQTLYAELRKRGLLVDWVTRDKRQRHFDLPEPSVKLITMHSSKGLEFNSVAIPGLERMPYPGGDVQQEAKLLYVAMTRATEALLLTYSGESDFTAHVRSSSRHQPRQMLSA